MTTRALPRFALTLALGALGTLTGCSDRGDDATPPAPAPAATKEAPTPDGDHQSALMTAISGGDAAAVSAAITAGADPNKGDTVRPLARALQVGNVAVGEALISAGAHADFTLDGGVPLLQHAAAGQVGDHPSVQRATAVAQWLQALIKGGAKVDQVGPNGERAITAAAERGDPLAVEALIKAGASIDVTRTSGDTPLRLALRSGDVTSVVVLLRAGAKPAAPEVECRAGRSLLGAAFDAGPAMVSALYAAVPGTPLHQAAPGGDAAQIAELVKGGADINARDALCSTPLARALTSGRGDAGSALIAAGADPSLTAGGWAPAEIAARFGRGEALSAMSAKGIKIGTGPLLAQAARSGEPKAVKALLDAGAPVDGELASVGDGALCAAVSQGHLAVTDLLIARGAKLAGSPQSRPLACAVSHPSMVEVLIKAGAPVAAVDADGETALHAAARAGMIPTIIMLLDAGAPIDAAGQAIPVTPRAAAEASGQMLVVKLLDEHRAKKK